MRRLSLRAWFHRRSRMAVIARRCVDRSGVANFATRLFEFFEDVRVASIVFVLQVLLLIATASGAQPLSDCIDATVRISKPAVDRPNERDTGTGCVFLESGGSYYILTNAHVAGTQPGISVSVEFWSGGYQAPQAYPGVTVAAWMVEGAYRDIAIVRVDGAGMPPTARPKVIPFAPRDYKLQLGQTIYSVGCARAAWPTAFRGHVRELVRANYSDAFTFYPPPAGGRSGSAVFDSEGQYIIGLIAWRDDEKRIGIGQSVASLYRAFDGIAPAVHSGGGQKLTRTAGRPLVDIYCEHGVAKRQCQQCGPGGCPPKRDYRYRQRPPTGPYIQQPAPQPGSGNRNGGGQDWSGFNPWQGGTTDQSAPEAFKPIQEWREPFNALTGRVSGLESDSGGYAKHSDLARLPKQNVTNVSWQTGVAAALGVSSPIGAGLVIMGWLLRRRRRRRSGSGVPREPFRWSVPGYRHSRTGTPHGV